MRLLWEERAAEAVLEFLRDTKVGCRSTAMARVGPPEEEGGGGTVKVRRVGRDHPRMYFSLSCSSGIFPLFLSSGDTRVKEIG